MPTTESTNCATGPAKCCATCKWWALTEQVCCNADSEHCADFTIARETCGGWEQL